MKTKFLVTRSNMGWSRPSPKHFPKKFQRPRHSCDYNAWNEEVDTMKEALVLAEKWRNPELDPQKDDYDKPCKRIVCIYVKILEARDKNVTMKSK